VSKHKLKLLVDLMDPSHHLPWEEVLEEEVEVEDRFQDSKQCKEEEESDLVE
jgi:hypothetical protein